jgi:hypothetical protein
MELMKSHKWLFAWSAALLAAAFVIKFIPLSKPVTQWVGGIELLLAAATGIAFGIAAFRKEE